MISYLNLLLPLAISCFKLYYIDFFFCFLLVSSVPTLFLLLVFFCCCCFVLLFLVVAWLSWFICVTVYLNYFILIYFFPLYTLSVLLSFYLSLFCKMNEIDFACFQYLFTFFRIGYLLILFNSFTIYLDVI